VRAADPPEPATKLEPHRVEKLIDELNSTTFGVREHASRELSRIGEEAIPHLRAAASHHRSPEVRQRAKTILDRLLDPYNRRPKVPPFDKSRVMNRVNRGGKINTKVVWTADNSYHVTADLTIVPPGKLTIEPGTIVLVDNGVSIHVTGELLAHSDKEPIVLAATANADDRNGHWGRLVLSGAGVTRLKNVEIRSSSGVHVSSTNACMWENVAVYDTSGDAVRYENSAGGGGYFARNLIIREATGAGILAHKGRREFHTVSISGVSVGVLAVDASPEITSLNIEYAREAGLVAMKSSRVEIKMGVFANCALAATFVDSSYGPLRDVTVRACTTGVIVDKRSNPTIDKVTFESMPPDATGLLVRGGSYPRIGKLTAGKDFRGKLKKILDSTPRTLKDPE
jgi:hypothetical protein